MNKSTTNLSRVEVRDSDKGEILESFILNSDGTPYDLSGKSLVFNENKDGDKFVSDPNVSVVDERTGHITYQLHDQVHSARGTAWFDVIDKSNGAKIDSTTDFYIEVRDGLKCTVYNTTYISDLEKLKQQMEALIQQADGELKAELQKAEQQLNQELQNFRNQYGALSNDFQNQFKAAQNARQQDYNNQKNAINQDWTNNKNSIWEQWNGDKANIDRQAQDTIQAIKDNAKQVLDKDQADWNAKQTQWDSTFSAIVKEWQVKTNSLNATVQDLTTKFGNIINELTDLMNNKLPDMNAKTDAVNKKIDQLKASLSDVDWTEYAHRSDNSGGVNLLANTENFSGFFSYKVTDGANNGFAFDKKEEYSNDENYSMIRTKVAHVYGSNMKNAPLGFGQNITLPAGTYTLSFLARHNGKRDEVRNLDLYSDWTDGHGGKNHGESDDIHGIWEKHHITFTTSQNHTYSSLRLQYFTDAEIPGGSLYLANLKLEAGSIATDWCQSYLDFDRLDGQNDPIDAPDFNNLTSTGIYMITQPDHGKNYPTGDWGALKVDNGNDSRIEQTFYADDNSGSVYKRQLVDKTWRDWKKVASIDDVNTRLPLAGGSMNKGSFINWNGGGINDRSGNIGGLFWQGATDNIRIFADENGNDNLDLAIQLGNDNSNHISFRDKDGAERAAITADGQFTGRTNWANVMNTGIDNPTLGRYISQSNTWNDIIGQDNGKNALAAIRDQSNGQGNTIGNFSSGIVFGGGDTKGMLNVAYDTPQARIIGGNGNGPVWHKDIAWKDDLKITVVRDFDVATKQGGTKTVENLNSQWLVDQEALLPFAEAINSIKGQGTYRINNAVDVNTLTGNVNQVTTYICTNIKNWNAPISQKSPNYNDQRGTLIVFNFDGNTKTQFWIPVGISGSNLGFAWRYWEGNNVPAWKISYDLYATRDMLQDLSDRLSGFMMTQSAFQRRVDYSNPAGNISDTTVNLNDYHETGILKLTNCHIQNGPYKTDNPHWIFVKITAFDGNTAYQKIDEGDNVYRRKYSGSWSNWFKYDREEIK